MSIDPPCVPSSFVQATKSQTPRDASSVDVLIIGAGPAGLMTAAALAQLGVHYRIIDKSPHRVGVGHADGFQCRTVEVFEALGIAHRVVHEGNEVAEIVFYDPDPKDESNLKESYRMPDTEPGTSYFRHMLLGQGRVEQFLIDSALEHEGPEVERNAVPISLDTDEWHLDVHDHETYPLSVQVQHMSPPETAHDPKSGLYRSNLFAANGSAAQEVLRTETIRAKYVIGCDGARSWVRQRLGSEYDLRGDSANTYWGVVDCKPVTDLPTVRMKNAIHSSADGSILTVPRERGFVRFYVQMGSLQPGERVDRSKVTIERIIAKAQRILQPYTFECPEVEWYTCYEIGQRLCDRFDYRQRVFIAGDACHLHSPKAGQGMNVSMMDTWNLSWKLAYVTKGLMKPEVLATYQSERRQIAQELIDFDYKFSRLFSGKPISAVAANGVSADEFRAVWKASGKWTTGTAVNYQPSSLVSASTNASTSPLAKGIIIGSHFPSFQVVCVHSAQDVQLQHRLKLGPWYLVAFAGALKSDADAARLKTFAAEIDAITRRYTPPQSDSDSIIQTITVFSGKRLELPLKAIPPSLMPSRTVHRYRATDTIYIDDQSYHAGHGRAYKGYGVAEDGHCPGVILIVRPDQYVAAVVSMEETHKARSFFEAVLTPQA